MDSIFQITNDILPEIKDSYVFLINYYKKNNDLENQLFYIERFIQVEEILSENYKYLSKNITQGYDVPELIKQKQKIIHQLNEENTLHKNIKYFTLLLALLTASFGVYQYFRRKVIKSKLYTMYLNAKATFDNELNMAKAIAQNGPKVVNDYAQAFGNLKPYVLEKDYTLERLDSLEKLYPKLNNDIALAKNSVTGNQTLEEMESVLKMYQNIVKYHLNLDYNERELIGDNQRFERRLIWK